MDFFGENTWIAEIFTVVFITVLIHTISAMSFRRLITHTEKHDGVWHCAFIRAMHRPMSVIIWVVGLSIAAQIAGPIGERPELVSLVVHLRSLGILIAITWFATRFIRLVQKNYIKHAILHGKVVDKTLIHAVGQLLTISVFITAALAAMQIFNLRVGALLAFGGIGGAGIAFAAKDLLANFFGGLVVYIDRPFKVGDWIRSPDKQIEGTVEYIGWRVTHIRTFDKRPLYVPNGLFLTISVENPSRMTNRRIYTNIGVRYNDASKIPQITAGVKTMLLNHPEIDPNQTCIVNLVEFGPSSLDFMVYTFTKTTDWVKFQEIQEDVFVKIIEIIENHGAECAFPTRTLYLQQQEPVQ